jgi:hypothetical protein
MTRAEAKVAIRETLVKAKGWLDANIDAVEENDGPSVEQLGELAEFVVDVIVVVKALEG